MVRSSGPPLRGSPGYLFYSWCCDGSDWHFLTHVPGRTGAQASLPVERHWDGCFDSLCRPRDRDRLMANGLEPSLTPWRSSLCGCVDHANRALDNSNNHRSRCVSRRDTWPFRVLVPEGLCRGIGDEALGAVIHVDRVS